MSKTKYLLLAALCLLIYLGLLIMRNLDIKEVIGGLLVFLAAFMGAEQWQEQLKRKALDKVENHLILLHKMVDAVRIITSPLVEFSKENDDGTEMSPITKSQYDREMKIQRHLPEINELHELVYETELYLPNSIINHSKKLRVIFNQISASHRTWLFFRSQGQGYGKDLQESFGKAFLLDDAEIAVLKELEAKIIEEKLAIRNKFYDINR